MLSSASLELPAPFVYTAIKTKLKLTKTQVVLMAKHAGIARFTDNWGLEHDARKVKPSLDTEG